MGFTKPKTCGRGDEYHNDGYQLSVLPRALCFRFCSCKKELFTCHLTFLPLKTDQLSHIYSSHIMRGVGTSLKIIILKNDSKLLNQSCEENDSNNPKVVNLVNSWSSQGYQVAKWINSTCIFFLLQFQCCCLFLIWQLHIQTLKLDSLKMTYNDWAGCLYKAWLPTENLDQTLKHVINKITILPWNFKRIIKVRVLFSPEVTTVI